MQLSPHQKKLLAVSLFAVAVISAIGVVAFRALRGGDDLEPSGDFVVVEAANREFDGSPALALTFSLPLDARSTYDKSIEVFEMPTTQHEGRDVVPEANNNEDEYNGEAQQKSITQVSDAAADVKTENGKLVPGAWIVGENPRLLFFPNVKPHARYVIKVSHSLKSSRYGELRADAAWSVITASVAPSYYFPSNGMVLPAKQNGGLPVVTVNVPEIDVQFLRVKPDQVSAFLDQVIKSSPKRKQKNNDEEDEDSGENDYYNNRSLRGAVNIYELDRLNKMTESVYLGRFLTEKRSNRRGITFLPVEDIKELKEPGIYVAVINEPGRFRYDYQATYFYVSDLGLHLRQFEKRADAYVSSLIDGKAVSGVEVNWLDAQGKSLAHADTDGNGQAVFAERPKGAKVVVARKGQQVSMIALKEPALDLSEFNTAGGTYKPVRLFPYSGRDLYRPGEQFELSVIARDADGQPVPPQPVQAILKKPDGKVQLTATWQPTEKTGNYYRSKIEIPADAATGSWTLELRTDPADTIPTTVFRFGVEEFLPERMKLDLDAPKTALSAEGEYRIKVTGNYLYGAPAAGNRLLGVVQTERNRNPIAAKLPGYEFGDSAEDTARTRKELDEDSLDENGGATVRVDLEGVAQRRSPYTVRTTLSLLESGGRPVVRSIERVYWPAPVLVGVRPLDGGEYVRENSPATFEVVRATQDATLKAGAGLPVRLFRENRDYYWRFEDQRGWHSGFTETDELVHTTSVSIAAASRGKLVVPVKYGRYRLEIFDPETRQTLRYRFYAGWSARADEALGIRPDRVALKLDKPGYKEGDTAKLTITPPHAGEALVTVEGDRTLWVKRISVSAGEQTISIPIDKEWKRHDLYVSVMALRPGNSGDKVTPTRALGIIHLPLDRSERKLKVTMDAPAKMLPDTTLKVKIKVADLKTEKAQVTLSAVDVGILNITRFTTPDPHGFFFGKLRYAPDQYDVYGRLIEKMQGERGKLKFGGDTAPKATRSMPKKVKLIDLFSGQVMLNDAGEAEVSLPVPDFNGTLRLMAVVSGSGRFGSQEAEVTVAAPIIAELATPRFLTIGDNATLALDLHNMSGAAQTLKVALTSPDGLKLGEGERSVTLKDQQKTILRFPVESGSAFGLAALKLQVSGKDIKFNREFALQVQAATPHQQNMRRMMIEPGQSVTVKDADFGGLMRQTLLAHMTVTSQPPIDVRSAVQGLLTYPYGCAEQTTSTAYPHVFVDEEAAAKLGLKRYTREQRAGMLDQAIGRLSGMQASNGGFSLWGNMSEYEYWVSSYVSNFLLDASEQGFTVPEGMRQRATDFLLKSLQAGVSTMPVERAAANSDLWRDYHYGARGRFGVLAYGAYVLARESKAPLSTLRQLYESRANAHSGLGLVHLGIALRLMGDEKRGDASILEGLGKERESYYWWGDYGSSLRDNALAYTLLIKHKINAPNRDTLISAIASDLDKQHRYLSTQEKLAVFLAGQSLTAATQAQWSMEASLGGKPVKVDTQGSWNQGLSTDQVSNGVKLTNTGKDQLYVELALSGNAAKMPAPRSDPIRLSRALFTPEGKAIESGRTFKVGESILVKLEVLSVSDIANVMVIDHIPAGLEIENTNIVQGEQMNSTSIGGINPQEAMSDQRIQHKEFRDDRFVAAIRLDRNYGYYSRGNVVTLFYRARVVTPGRFVFPTLYAEDIYRPNIFGLIGGSEVITVVDTPAKTKAP